MCSPYQNSFISSHILNIKMTYKSNTQKNDYLKPKLIKEK